METERKNGIFCDGGGKREFEAEKIQKNKSYPQ
jgi:hypothetical protein